MSEKSVIVLIYYRDELVDHNERLSVSQVGLWSMELVCCRKVHLIVNKL